MSNEPIEAFNFCSCNSTIKHCTESEVRALEDKYAELEKKLEIAVEAIEKARVEMNGLGFRNDLDKTIKKLKVFNTHCKHCGELVAYSPVILCQKCGKHPGFQGESE